MFPRGRSLTRENAMADKRQLTAKQEKFALLYLEALMGP